MIIIICLDDQRGMMFNHRRQSSDRMVTERIQTLCQGKRLWMKPYSDKLYGSLDGIDISVEDDFLSLAGSGEFCLVETERLSPFAEKIEKILIYWWNRTYPADFYFDLDLSRYVMTGREELEGYSHEKILEETYERR